MKALALVIGVLTASSAMAQAPAEAPKMISSKLIARAQATAMVQDTITACAARKETVAVYVTDADGYMRAAMSSDDSSPIGLQSVTRKTAAVLEFKQPTRALAARLESDPAFRDGAGKDPRYFFHPGAVPLYRGGAFVGVLAAGGGHDKDEACVLEALSHQKDLSVHP